MVSSGCYISIVAAVYVLNMLRRSHQIEAFVADIVTQDENALKEIATLKTSMQSKQPSNVKAESL